MKNVRDEVAVHGENTIYLKARVTSPAEATNTYQYSNASKPLFLLHTAQNGHN